MAWFKAAQAGGAFFLGWASNKALDTFYDGMKESYKSPPTLPSDQEKKIARLEQDLKFAENANQFHRNELKKQEQETIRVINHYEDLMDKYKKEKF